MGMIERKKAILLNEPHLATASGSIATFDTDMRSKLKECKINFLPIQSGSGDPSPTNVRNISGWNSINGCHTRKNLLNIDALISSPSNTVNNFNFKHYLELKLKPNTYYTVSTSYNDSGLNVLYANGVNGDKNGVKADTPRTILSSSDGIVFLMLYDRNGIEKFENKEVTVQLEEGNIVTSYEPVNNIPVSWQSEAGTLYGGYVDLISGEVWKTLGFRHFTENDKWSIASSSITTAPYRYYVTNVDKANGIYRPIISDKLGSDTNWQPNLYKGNLNNGGNFIWGAPPELSSVKIMKEWLQSIGGFDVVYELTTPVIIASITPQQIKTLIGRNNIWLDAGNVEVKFWTH